jgi:chromosome segregation ATPase
VKLSPIKKIKDLVKKFSPQKRKSTADSSLKPVAKRLRSNTTAPSIGQNKVSAAPLVLKKTSSARPASAKGAEVEKLREENFSLKITIDDLEQQLAVCEAEVRAEVVEMMNEQLQESKEWYEGRIDNLKEQLKHLQATSSKLANNDSDAQKRFGDLYERINECEEEMTRMREEHEAEKAADLLNLTNIHVAEMEQATLAHKDEIGTLRHQAEELRASHDAILAKYNALLLSCGERDSSDTFDSVNPDAMDELSSPNFKKLPRERCSDVASTSTSFDIKSPKKKGKGWGFLRSPAKVAMGDKSRSPLGNVDDNVD